jgi:hypothetical protein
LITRASKLNVVCLTHLILLLYILAAGSINQERSIDDGECFALLIALIHLCDIFPFSGVCGCADHGKIRHDVAEQGRSQINKMRAWVA